MTYDIARRGGGPLLLRRAEVEGDANEGVAKVSNIRVALGRRPAFAAGNSPGDAETLEYAATGDGPCMALLVNHDDAERKCAYESGAGSFVAVESVRDTAARLGGTQTSMRDDWTTVFPS